MVSQWWLAIGMVEAWFNYRIKQLLSGTVEAQVDVLAWGQLQGCHGLLGQVQQLLWPVILRTVASEIIHI